MDDSAALPANFCIIESRETVTDFANLDAQSIRDNLEARKTKIFLLLEEMRRLRIQQRLRTRQDKTNTAVVDAHYWSEVGQWCASRFCPSRH